MAKMFINGQWADALGGETYAGKNPANGQVIETVPLAGQEDIGAAVKAAQAAFRGWAATSPDDRAALLRKGIQAVEAQAKEIAALLTDRKSTRLNSSHQLI